MRQITLLLMLLSLLSACSSADNDSSNGNSPAPASFSGEVDIIYPTNGTVVYAETLTITGTLFGADSQAITLQLVNPDGEAIAEASITAQTGDWQVELPHGYTGEPTEITIRAIPSGSDVGAYDSHTIFMADLSFRPEGRFATIRTPSEDSPVGGDSVLVQGTASGLSTNVIFVTLLDANGNPIDEQRVELFNPFFIDEVVWQTELITGGYLGNSQIQIVEDGDAEVLTTVRIVIGDSAG